MKTLVLLDFDGTLYRGDSMLDFARFVDPGRFRRSVFSVMWMLPLAWISTTWRERMKARFLSINFTGLEQAKLFEEGRRFHSAHRERCYVKVRQWLAEVDRTVHDIYLVSGSSREWLEPFASEWNVELICTELAYADGRCTGRWSGVNLRGQEKVNAVRRSVDLSTYTQVLAFGNERADRSLAEIADRVEIHYFR